MLTKTGDGGLWHPDTTIRALIVVVVVGVVIIVAIVGCTTTARVALWFVTLAIGVTRHGGGGFTPRGGEVTLSFLTVLACSHTPHSSCVFLEVFRKAPRGVVVI